ncbi:MAG: hypothetical protein ACE5HU_01300 [Acidobacteriota bacterium]
MAARIRFWTLIVKKNWTEIPGFPDRIEAGWMVASNSLCSRRFREVVEDLLGPMLAGWENVFGNQA